MAEPRQRPFYKPDPLGWPEIAAALSKPWPEAAIAHDLVWWADQVAVGRVAKMPGAVTLAARWGLSRHSRRVRLALGYVVAPESPACCAGAGASVARDWRATGASVAHFSADSDDCTSPAGASVAHDWRVGGASVAHDCDGQSDEKPAYIAASDTAPRARGTEPRAQIPEPSHTNTNARTPAQALTASPDAVGRAGVYEAGPVPEQVPERRPLPIQPVPRLPIAPPPAPPSASEQAMHAALSAPPSQRGNLAAIVAPEPAPRPSQPPVEAVQPMTGERVTLPGDVIDLLEAMGPRALGFARILESNGIADTGALLAVPEAQVKYLRGMGAQRAQQLVEHIAAHWGVLFASEAEATMRIGHALDEHAKRKAEQQQAPQGLRVVAGGRR